MWSYFTKFILIAFAVGLIFNPLMARALNGAASILNRNNPLSLSAHELIEGKGRRGKNGVMAKAGYDLALIYQEHQDYQRRGGLKTLKKAFSSSRSLAKIKNEKIVVDLVVSGNVNIFIPLLKNLGMEQISIFGRIISGNIPIASLKKISQLAAIRAIRPSYSRVMNAATITQGDQATYSNIARNTFAVTGGGVTVGTLSDSYDCLGGAAADVASNDLPLNVTVLAEDVNCTSVTDEGRAMMQIIHDVAPSSAQYFHTANGGMASFANGIINLNNAGADIINDDILYYAEPMFQDGIITQAIDTVKAAGVAYFTAAGNNASQSYESVFRDSNVKGYAASSTRHDFDAGAAVDSLMQITIPANKQIIFVLQWDDPFFSISGAPGADTDMDIILYSDTGQIITGSINSNVGADAYEIFGYTNTTNQSVVYQLAIDHVSGPFPGLVKLIYFGVLSIDEYATNSSSMYGHAVASGAQTVAAARYTQTPAYGVSPAVIEGFSSKGGTPTLFDINGNSLSLVRQKPNLVGPDGVDNTFFGSDYDGSGHPNFFGTSAATPHAAAVAALIKSFENTLLVDEIYTLMQNTAVDMQSIGFDYMSGYGLINANAALTLLDIDLDTIPSSRDNCPSVSNIGQENNDLDAQGDVCDDDDDNDGVPDTDEIAWGLDPFKTDSDLDGLSDYVEVCFDGDCLTYIVYPLGADLDATNNDTDGDGILDGNEINLGTNPLLVEPGPQILTVPVSADRNIAITITGSGFCVEQCGNTLSNTETIVMLGCNVIALSMISSGQMEFIIPIDAITSQIKITTPFGFIESGMFNVNGTYQAGDVNADGLLNAPDILISQQINLNIIVPTTEQLNRADISPPCAANGLINASDLMLLQQKILFR